MSFPFKDHALKDIVAALNEQSSVLSKALFNYLELESQRKTAEARAIRAAEGSSQAEKRTNAESMEERITFNLSLAKAEARYKLEQLKYDVLEKEYQAQYLTLKLDAAHLNRPDPSNF